MTSAKNAIASQETPSTEVRPALWDWGFLREKKHGPRDVRAPTCLHQLVSTTQRGKLSCIFDDEEVEWNVRILVIDVKLAFHFIYTRDTVTRDLSFHCIFFLC